MLTASKIVDALLEAVGPMRQRRPFSVTLTDEYKQSLRDDAARFNTAYGIFFTSSGQARVERINPTAHYSYIWRTDVGEAQEEPPDSPDATAINTEDLE